MSYDLMVFEPSAAPQARPQFMEWYEAQTKWSEDHDYNNPEVCSTALQSWFKEMTKFFPPMNGPSATDDVDDPRMTDYCVGRNVVYSLVSGVVPHWDRRRLACTGVTQHAFCIH